MKPKFCRNCHQKKANRPRGLCWSCYYKPGVRDEYPSTSKYARRGVGGIGSYKLPAAACRAEAGSEERIRTLAERARRGESLWHPDDNPAIAGRPNGGRPSRVPSAELGEEAAHAVFD